MLYFLETNSIKEYTYIRFVLPKNTKLMKRVKTINDVLEVMCAYGKA